MTREEIQAALTKAEAAGNAEDARRLSAALQRFSAAPQQRPQLDPFHMVKPEARARVATRQTQGWTPSPPAPAADPLAPIDPTNIALAEEKRVRDMEARRQDQVSQAHAQFKAREAAKAAPSKAQAELDRWRQGNFLGIPNTFREKVSNTVKSGAAAFENWLFGGAKAGLDVVDPNRNASKFISEQVTPAVERVGRGIGEALEGPSGRFGGMAGPAVGGITGGLTEWGATMARDPQQGLTEAVDVLEPTHQLARGGNVTAEAFNDFVRGKYAEAQAKMQEAAPDLISGTLGIIPTTSMTVSALRNAARAPQREVMDQIARIPAMSSGRRGPVVNNAPTPPQIGAMPRPRAEQRADDILLRKLEADGVTIEDVRRIRNSLANRKDSGVYETLGEALALSGKTSAANVRGLQMAGGAAPGPLQEALVAQVNENAKNMPKRLTRAATRATGKDAKDAVDTIKALDERLKTESQPLYDAAYAAPLDPVIYQTQIAPMLAEELGQDAAKSALRGLKTKLSGLKIRAASPSNTDPARIAMEISRMEAAAKSLDDFIKNAAKPADDITRTEPPVLTVQALDEIKRAFDDQISTSGRYTAGNIGSAKRNFAEAVSNATDGAYGQALGNYEDISRLDEAFNIGIGALGKKTWQLKTEIDNGINGRAFSGGEIEAIAMGVARSIEDMIESGDQRALTTLIKDKALINIATALGSEKAAQTFEQSIRRLAANREWGRRVAGGSDTAMRTAAIRDAANETDDVVTRTLDRIETSGNQFSIPGLVNDVAIKPIAKVAKDFYRHLRYPGIYDKDVNQALVPLLAKPLTEGNLDEIIRRVEARLAEKGRPPAGSPAGATPAKAGKTTTTPASATVTGAVAGGVGGAALPAEDEDEQLMNALFGAAGGGALAAGANRLLGPRRGAAPKAGPQTPPAQMRAPAGEVDIKNLLGGQMETLYRNPSLRDLQRFAARTKTNEFRWVRDADGNIYIGNANTNVHDAMLRGLREIGVPLPGKATSVSVHDFVKANPGQTSLGGMIRRNGDQWEIKQSEGNESWLPFSGQPKPPAQSGFGGKPLTQKIIDFYERIKRSAALTNDPRHLNPVRKAIHSLSDVDKALIARNAQQPMPVSAIEAGRTPDALAELLGRAVKTDSASGNPRMEGAVRSHQDRLAADALQNQRGEGRFDKMDKEVTGYDRKMATQQWFPAREAERDAIMARLMEEGDMGIGGIPERAPELDRYREGITRGYGQGALDLDPLAIDQMRKVLMDPQGAAAAANMIDEPYRPWVSNTEKTIIDLGTKGVVAGGAAYGMSGMFTQEDETPNIVMGGEPVRSVQQGLGGMLDAFVDPRGERQRQSEWDDRNRPDNASPLLGSRGPYEVLPENLMPTANPGTIPDWLNQGIPDTRMRAQQRLVALGYAPATLPTGKPFVDGIEGFATRAAAEDYQRDNGLPVTGNLDPLTLRHLLLRDTNYGPEPFARPRGERPAFADER